jgi:acyl-CoA dehydrogenase
MTWHAAAKLDAHESIKHESAMVKVFVSEAVGWRVGAPPIRCAGR